MARVRVLFAALFAQALVVHPCLAQQMWAPGGIHLCQSGCPADLLHLLTDATGGAYVAWRDSRNSDDVYLQRVTGLGLTAPGWPADGLPIVVLPSVQELSSLAPDGLGGALVAWEDWRTLSTTSIDPYVQRVLADGSLPPGWYPNGNPATLFASAQETPQVAPDGVGGAFVLWQDNRDQATNGFDMYAQHLTANGSVAPGWPSSGLAVCTAPGNQGPNFFALPDDSGGVLFAWSDGRPDAPGGYALRVHPDGSRAAGWPANGLLLTSRGNDVVARDDAGGIYAVSPTVNLTSGGEQSYYLLRYTFAGTVAAGWPANGVLVCSPPGIRGGASLALDGAGGAFVSWFDYRPPYDVTGGQIFAMRVLSNGTLAPGWTPDGTLVSDPSSGLQSYSPFMAPDDQGGGFVVWQSQGGCCDPSWIQHLTGSGQVTAGWPLHGLQVAPSGAQFDTQVTTDGHGGAIVAWDERCCGRYGAWAQRFGANGPTPVLVSLVSAEAKDGQVTLDWFAGGGAGLTSAVYRRTEHSEWESLASLRADGTGHLRWQDRAVSPGERYAYRLGYFEGGLEQFSAETWVVVPAPQLALEGLRPNPATGELVAAFTLPSGAPARLEVLDVTGRMRLVREVGDLGAGSHVVRLGGSVPAGMYWLRLLQGGRSLLARGVVVR